MRFKKEKKWRIALLLSAGMALLLVGCKTNTSQTVVTKSEIERIKPVNAGELTFGWSVYTLENEFFKRMDTSLKEKAAQMGITLLAHNQNNSADELVRGCKSLIAQDVAVLLVSPCNPEKMDEIVTLAHEKNIPVVIVDIGDGGSDKDAIIVSDGYNGGKTVAEYALGLLEEKKSHNKGIGILKCEKTAVYANRRGDGFQDTVTAQGYVIDVMEIANSSKEEAYQKTRDIMQKHPDIAALFAENDMMAVGAAQALKDEGKSEEVLVFGFDGNEQAINSIVEGLMDGTMLQNSEKMGTLGIEIADKLVKGEKLDYDNPQQKEFYVEGYMIGKDGEVIQKD